MLYIKLIAIFIKTNLGGYFTQFLACLLAILLFFILLALPQVLEVQAGPGKDWAADLNILAPPEITQELEILLDNFLLKNPAKLYLTARQIYLPNQSFITSSARSLNQTFNFKEVNAADIYLPLIQEQQEQLCLITGVEVTSLAWNLEVTGCDLNTQAKTSLLDINVQLEELAENHFLIDISEEQLTKKQRLNYYNFLQQSLNTRFPLSFSGIGLDLSAASLNSNPVSLEQIKYQKALAAAYQLVLPNKFQPTVLLNTNSAIDLNGRFTNYLSLGWLNNNAMPSKLGTWTFRPLIDINPKAKDYWSGIAWVGTEGFNELIEQLASQQLDGEVWHYYHLNWIKPKQAKQLYQQISHLPEIKLWLAKDLNPLAELNFNTYIYLVKLLLFILLGLILFAGITNFYTSNKSQLAFLRYQGLKLPLYTPALVIAFLFACLVAGSLVWVINDIFKQNLIAYSFPAYNLPLTALISSFKYVLALVGCLIIYESFGFNRLANYLLEDIENEQ